MKRCRLVLFDFDGTLADSFALFMAMLDELARRHGLRPETPQDMARMRRQIMRANMWLVVLPPWKRPLAAASFIRLMRERGDDVPLFDGIGDVLRQLHASGLPLALVTSNSADNARRTLGLELAALFAHCEGCSPLLDKHGRIRRVLAHGGVDPSETLHVGEQHGKAKQGGRCPRRARPVRAIRASPRSRVGTRLWFATSLAHIPDVLLIQVFTRESR